MHFNYFLSYAALLLALNTVPTYSTQPIRPIEIAQDTSIATPRALETKWYYRYVNGEYQKTLMVNYAKQMAYKLDACIIIMDSETQ